jgi:hypothetical protein
MNKNKSAYYSFMEPYFRSGNQEAILLAKKEYTRIYKTRWKKESRKRKKEVTISLSKEEYMQFKNEAKRHSLAVATYIKKATQAYQNKTYLVPAIDNMQKIIQLVTMMYLLVEGYEEETNVTDKFSILKYELNKLETDLRYTFLSPITIEQAIEKKILNDPNYRETIISFIQNIPS